MKTRLIEFTETVKISGAEHLEKERKFFPEDEALEYIGNGWAKDAETGETGNRVAGAKAVSAESIKTKIS